MSKAFWTSVLMPVLCGRSARRPCILLLLHRLSEREPGRQACIRHKALHPETQHYRRQPGVGSEHRSQTSANCRSGQPSPRLRSRQPLRVHQLTQQHTDNVCMPIHSGSSKGCKRSDLHAVSPSLLRLSTSRYAEEAAGKCLAGRPL